MANLIESQASQLARAAADIAHVAAVGPLDGVKVHLTKASLDITPSIPLATLTTNEANYTGYTAEVVAWDVPGIAGDGTVEVVATPIVFRPTDAVTPNSIWAAFITDGATTVWYYAGQVDGAPLALPDALHQIIVTVRFRPATNSVVITIT